MSVPVIAGVGCYKNENRELVAVFYMDQLPAGPVYLGRVWRPMIKNWSPVLEWFPNGDLQRNYGLGKESIVGPWDGKLPIGCVLPLGLSAPQVKTTKRFIAEDRMQFDTGGVDVRKIDDGRRCDSPLGRLVGLATIVTSQSPVRLEPVLLIDEGDRLNAWLVEQAASLNLYFGDKEFLVEEVEAED